MIFPNKNTRHGWSIAPLRFLRDSVQISARHSATDVVHDKIPTMFSGSVRPILIGMVKHGTCLDTWTPMINGKVQW